jgi:hypothetical protein
MNGVIDSLKRKGVPNPPKPFIVNIGVQEGNKQNMSRADPMNKAEPMSKAEPMNVNVEEKPNIGFKIIDKRDSKIDRNFILERFRQQLPDINKSLLATTNAPMREAPMRDKQPPGVIANNPTEAPMREAPMREAPMRESPMIDTQPQVDIANKPTEGPKKPKAPHKRIVIGEELNEPLGENVDKPQPEPVVTVVKKRYTKKRDPAIIDENINLDLVIFGKDNLGDMVPKKKDKLILRASSYYMNNRLQFIQKLSALFKPRRDQSKGEEVSCEKRSTEAFSLLTHQEVVRDYLNSYSPYRGLLIYHGLGSGKTCTSIAIAEGMKSDKPILIMTPASLKTNYFSELKKCGDDLYRKNQYWEYITPEKAQDYIAPLAKAMSLTPEHIQRKGVWLVNVKKESNFEDLTSVQKNEIDAQLDVMISAKYSYINYKGGLDKEKLEALTSGFTVNPFDNKVVVIDEVHNLVSRIVNKLNNHDSVSYRLYDYLMSASNAKLVFLSGTPIINYPNEIAILFNMLRGYIKTWSFPVISKTTNKLNTNAILKMFEDAKFKTYDYINYSGNILTITRNPFGFVNVVKRGTAAVEEDIAEKYNGVTLNTEGNISDDEFKTRILSILQSNKLDVVASTITTKNHKALPDNSDTFLAMFVNPDTGVLQNTDLFKRRVLGLTSYFKSAQESLLPKYKRATDRIIERIPMSDHQFNLYAKARKDERDREKKQKKQAKMADKNLFKMASSYRVFSRALCNFSFPDDIPRPMKTNKTIEKSKSASEEEEEEKEIDENEFDAISVDEDTGVESADPDTRYLAEIKAALRKLGENSAEYLSKDGLQTYSPKMLQILENIEDEENVGLHLVYSQFRSLEGIEVFKMVLEQNGFAEFRLVKSADREWDIAETKPGDEGKPKFVLYTGTETIEEKEIIRHIYNSNWENLSINLRNKLRAIHENNFMGEIIKIFMITSSGAEGINLENTRFVHIMEPYWNPVRVDQVIGRARRICSHKNLPPELQTVRVHLYLSTFSAEQMKSEKNIDIRVNDVSRVDRKTPVSTDEYLFELSNTKETITQQILTATKESAMDCALYNKKDSDEPLVCYNYGRVFSNDFSTLPDMDQDATHNPVMNLKKTKIKGKRVTIEGREYILETGTNKLYNPVEQTFEGVLVMDKQSKKASINMAMEIAESP